MAKIMLVLITVLLLSGCAPAVSPQEMAARRQASGNNYDLAYVECNALATQQVGGPGGNQFSQIYFLSQCLHAKGY